MNRSIPICSKDDLGRRVNSILPDIKPTRWPYGSDARKYGASYIIARQLGWAYVPRSFASWQHGWINYAKKLIHPFQLMPPGHSPDETALVAHKKHAKVLEKSFGFKDVHAIGLPFVYTKRLQLGRINSSLLVMPPHTLPGTKDSWNRKRYVELIKKYEEVFEHVAVCLNYHDIKKGLWVDGLDKKNISWVMGARVDDKNALRRMKHMFSLFENMTTNVLGSHVPYASYCECKASIHGPYFSPSNYSQKDRKMSEYPKVEKLVQLSLEKNRVKKKYDFLFSRPLYASKHSEWAADELGARNKVSIDKVFDLLGWNLKDQVIGYKNKFLKRISKL
jgi:hypothetical protein